MDKVEIKKEFPREESGKKSDAFLGEKSDSALSSGNSKVYRIAVAVGLFLVVAFLILRPATQTDLKIEVLRQGEGRVGLDDVAEFSLQFYGEDGGKIGNAKRATVAVRKLTRPIQEAIMAAGIGGLARFDATYETYVPGGRPSEFAQGRPVRGEVEIFSTIPGEFAVPAFPRKYSVGILAMDMTGLGLQTPENQPWQRGAKTTDWADARHCRAFTMDGVNHRLWEWPGSEKVGLFLVDLSGTADGNAASAPKEAGGGNLLGTYTGLQVWKSAYDVLAVLDANGDGEVSGEELETVFLWVDENGDARVDDGEVRPASEYVQSLSVSFGEDDLKGRTSPLGGVTLLDGQKRGTWEFWSRGRADLAGGQQGR